MPTGCPMPQLLPTASNIVSNVAKQTILQDQNSAFRPVIRYFELCITYNIRNTLPSREDRPNRRWTRLTWAATVPLLGWRYAINYGRLHTRRSGAAHYRRGLWQDPVNPRNFRSSGRATALFVSLTFSRSLMVRNRLTEAMTPSQRCPPDRWPVSMGWPPPNDAPSPQGSR
jgi:hypothetical protein